MLARLPAACAQHEQTATNNTRRGGGHHRELQHLVRAAVYSGVYQETDAAVSTRQPRMRGCINTWEPFPSPFHFRKHLLAHTATWKFEDFSREVVLRLGSRYSPLTVRKIDQKGIEFDFSSFWHSFTSDAQILGSQRMFLCAVRLV